MQIEQLSEHGYKVIDVLPDDLFEKVYALSQTTGQFVLQDDGRRKIGLDEQLYEQLQTYFQAGLKAVTPDIQRLTWVEVWQDPPGYTNAYHYDDPAVHNIMIVYLETHPDSGLGTGYVENNGTEYKEVYYRNHGIIVLNSNKIMHGMVGTVPANTTRYTMYLNWQ